MADAGEFINKIAAGLEPDELAAEAEIINGAMKDIYPTLPAGFVPVLLATLEANRDHVKVLIPIISILYYISSRQIDDSIISRMPLYLHILERYRENELICRYMFGMLFNISNSEDNKHRLISANILPLMISILEIHGTKERVYFGATRLLNILASDVTKKNILLDAGIGEHLIKTFFSIVTAGGEKGDIVDLCTDVLDTLSTDNPTSNAFFAKYTDELLTFIRIVGEKSYINIDKILNRLGISALGNPLPALITDATPKGFETVHAFPPSVPKSVYTSLGHGREFVSEIPLDVPPGCVYVTFAVCGGTSKHPYKILDAFLNPSIREKLRDPVKNLKALTKVFGETLHVHYPEAEDPTSRTYFDVRYLPFASFSEKSKDCWSLKSGLYRMGDVRDLWAPDNIKKGNGPLFKYGAKLDCLTIAPKALKYIYSGALYPKLDIVMRDIGVERNLSYKLLRHEITKCRFTQSWAFSNFPGVHYNFICRSHSYPDEAVEISNAIKNRTERRRRNSKAAADLLISRAIGGKRKTRRQGSKI